jgi:hypothetical protein
MRRDRLICLKTVRALESDPIRLEHIRRAARIGWGEFSVLLTDMGIEGAIPVAVRDRMERPQLSHRKVPWAS